jgi:hypothetical protein
MQPAVLDEPKPKVRDCGALKGPARPFLTMKINTPLFFFTFPMRPSPSPKLGVTRTNKRNCDRSVSFGSDDLIVQL